MFCRSSGLLLSFKDPKVFRNMPTLDLIRSYSLFTAFSFNPLICHSYRLYQLFPRTFEFLAKPAFSQFCAGSTEVDLAPRLSQLRLNGVNAILDYAAESSEDLDSNVTILQRAVSSVAGTGDRVAVKLTALATVEDLERLSALFVGEEASIDGASLLRTAPFIKPALDRIEAVVSLAKQSGVSVYIDAEWLAIQPGIEYLTLYLMNKYNRESTTVFTTYQCYLRRTPSVIERDMAMAAKHRFKIGAKVVRGAYLTSERDQAKILRLPDPVCENYEMTAAQYHSALSVLAKAPMVDSVLVATHNPDSINYALTLDENASIKKFTYAQLLGMADNITFGLGAAKKPVFKYLPYGPMDEVMPYLLRRAVENSALMGSVHVKHERQMVKAEILRRLLGRSL